MGRPNNLILYLIVVFSLSIMGMALVFSGVGLIWWFSV